VDSGGRRLNDLGSKREWAERFGGERIVLCGDRGVSRVTASSTEEGRPATLGWVGLRRA
jgi:hypothetical protein